MLSSPVLDLLRDAESVIHLNPEIADHTFQLRVAEQQLHYAQIASLLVDLSRLCSAHRVRSKEARVQPNPSHPLADQPGVLSSR